MNIRKFNLNKLICLIIICLSFILISSCNNDKERNDIVQTKDYTLFPDEMKGIIKDKNIYVTSIGQDSEMTKFELSTLTHQTKFTL